MMEELEIQIESSSPGIYLSGNLTNPTGEHLVLLFSGSGPQDRNETISEKKPFRELAIGLGEMGYAVFRWDDRGVGKSGGDYFKGCSSETLVEDGCYIIRFFRTKKPYQKIILLGHSQGTLISTSVAKQGSPEALVLCAGIARHGKITLLDQHYNICQSLGYDKVTIQQSLREKEDIFKLLTDFEDQQSGGIPKISDLEKKLFEYFLAGTDPSHLAKEERASIQLSITDLLEWEWRYLLRVDPLHDLKELNLPILAIFGDNDVQVNSAEEIKTFNALDLENMEVRTLKNHNHLFQPSQIQSIDHYNQLGKPFSAESIRTISEWLNRTI